MAEIETGRFEVRAREGGILRTATEELVCTRCGETIADIEHGDDFAVLTDVAKDHASTSCKPAQAEDVARWQPLVHLLPIRGSAMLAACGRYPVERTSSDVNLVTCPLCQGQTRG